MPAAFSSVEPVLTRPFLLLRWLGEELREEARLAVVGLLGLRGTGLGFALADAGLLTAVAGAEGGAAVLRGGGELVMWSARNVSLTSIPRRTYGSRDGPRSR